MKKINLLIALVLSLISYNSASASTTTPTKADRTAQNIAKLVTIADKEIDTRIEALNKTSAKVSEMKNVSATIKSTISSTTQIEIANLSALRSKIDADTDETTLKSDLKSITASYRIYALVRPQIEILAAADKINTITGLLNTLANKIGVRINTAKNAGNDTSVLDKTLSNTMLKLTDAKAQSDAAISRSSVLTPDNGDMNLAKSNKDALVKSRADIKVGNMDLHAAKSNIETIIKLLRKNSPVVNATSTPTVNQ